MMIVLAFGLRRPFTFVVFVALFVGALTTGVAIEPGQPSKTSIFAASLRAIGAKHPDPAFRNPDDLGIAFVGRRERALLAEFPMDALDLEYRQALERLASPDRASVTQHGAQNEASRRRARRRAA